MLCYNFYGLEGFKARFGIVEHGNGEKSRKNKILLEYIKQPSLFKEASKTGDYSLINISSMSELKEVMIDRITKSGENLEYEVNLINYTFRSSRFETDEYKGLCEDGDLRSVRYINHTKNGNIYKMKAGKFFRSLILETEFGQTLPEQVLNWLCEEFSAEWQTFTLSTFPENQLFVNENFSDIYSSSRCKGPFHSCMTDRDLHYFYTDAVKAKAAYLQDENGNIIARCIIYTEVYDEDGKLWRLAERQYSTDCNDILKRALVDALIRGGHIDGYKKIGAGCGDSREFVDINGNSLADKQFHIDCKLETYDTLSYQDSFKFYNYDEGIAYNYEPKNGCSYYLDTTDGSIDGDDSDDEPQEYDSYHDRDAWEVVTVWVGGERMTCDTDDLEDFVYIDDAYHHEDDVFICPCCGKRYLAERFNEQLYSEVTEEEYCSVQCLKKAEEAYKKECWHYSDYDDEYVQDPDELTTYQAWNWDLLIYETKTIKKTTLEELGFHRFGGIIYDTVSSISGRPFNNPEIEVLSEQTA